MSTRDEILDRLRKNVRETYDMPDLSFKKRSFEDPVKAFIQTTITTAGAKLTEIKPDADINEKIKEEYPKA